MAFVDQKYFKKPYGPACCIMKKKMEITIIHLFSWEKVNAYHMLFPLHILSVSTVALGRNILLFSGLSI